MSYIKNLKIIGFKKFKYLEINFNKDKNIIIGENESGKSTILEAINIVFSKLHRNADKHIIKELLNTENKEEFFKNPSVENLPSILIELEFELRPTDPYSQDYYGLVYDNTDNKTKKYGIQFTCKIDLDLIDKVMSSINSGKIPYEYYTLSWFTFNGESYNLYKKPFNLLFIDNSLTDSNSSFNYYNKNLFYNKFNPDKIMEIKHDYNQKLEDMFNDLNLDELGDNQKFGINYSRVILENIISIYDNGIPLENKGKGIENLIKTRISLNKSKNNVDVVIIEEPENHLSHTNLKKMLTEIENSAKESQLIITTHNNLIAKTLDLKHILWHKKNNDQMISLRDIPSKVSNFFKKSDNHNLIQFLLAEKVLLVEGATEFMLMPKIFYDLYGEKIELKGIDLLSCYGITFDNYLTIAKLTNKKVAVITDNDGNQEKVVNMHAYNKENENTRIFMDSNIENFTWEVCLYNLNEDYFLNKIKIQENAKYNYKNRTLSSKHLGKMLNNKTDVAFDILIENPKLDYPNYVKDALEWLKN